MERRRGHDRQPQPSVHREAAQPSPPWSSAAHSPRSKPRGFGLVVPNLVTATEHFQFGTFSFCRGGGRSRPAALPAAIPQGCTCQKSPPQRTVAWTRNSSNCAAEPWLLSGLHSSAPISCSRVAASPSSQRPSCKREGRGSGGTSRRQHLPFLPPRPGSVRPGHATGRPVPGAVTQSAPN